MNRPTLLLLLFASMLPAQQSDPAFLPWLPSPGIAGAGSAVEATARPASTTIALNRTAGLQLLDGELWGAARGYKVLFTADGFEFTPVLGPAAPRNYPLRFRMESCGRGGDFAPVAAGLRHHDGLRVEYDRGTVVERYEIGTEAMEQSFVFARRPAGHGDFVVRGRLHTDMVVTAENGGLRIEQPGIGGFRIGAVTGIDANGVRAAGNVRYELGMLELSLPAEFVDHAALPFVLDPPIGGTFGVTTVNTLNDITPEAAFDVSNDCYFVAWERIVSSTDHDIVGQRILRSGILLGGLVSVDVNAPESDTEPTVANFNGADAFVVAYSRAGVIRARSVAAANGAVSLAITIASGLHPSLGGDSVNPSIGILARGVCVWEGQTSANPAVPAVQATRVIVNANLSLTTSGTVHTLMQGTTSLGRPALPSISKSGGGLRRYAVVFQRDFVASSWDPWAVVVGDTGAPLAPPISLDNGSMPSVQARVDGFGSNWVVAWEDPAFFATRIRACSMSLTGSPAALVAAPSQFLPPAAFGQNAASVIWTGTSAVISHTDMSTLSQSEAILWSLDPFQCVPCEGRFPLVGGTLNEDTAGCSTLSGNGPVDEALVVWASNTAFNLDISATLWRSADGTATSIQGGCGLGGSAFATCAIVGNANFTHRLRGSTPLAVSVLVQSLSQGSMTCGPCTLAPSLPGALASLFITDALGNVAFPSAIPGNASLSGLQLYEQWLTLRPGGACSTYGNDLSNALRITIE